MNTRIHVLLYISTRGSVCVYIGSRDFVPNVDVAAISVPVTMDIT